MTKEEVFALVNEEINKWNELSQDMFRLTPADEVNFYFMCKNII